MLALLSGGNIELNRLNDELCDDLCAALRARAHSGGDDAVDFEGRNPTGETPFLMACTTGCVEFMELLAEAGCDTAVTNNYGTNALMSAAESREAAAVRAALAAGWCELEARDSSDGDTAFLRSCYQGHVECMQVLAEEIGRASGRDRVGTLA